MALPGGLPSFGIRSASAAASATTAAATTVNVTAASRTEIDIDVLCRLRKFHHHHHANALCLQILDCGSHAIVSPLARPAGVRQPFVFSGSNQLFEEHCGLDRRCRHVRSEVGYR